MFQFQNEKIVVPYEDEAREYDLWFRPMWDWVIELVRHPVLAQNFEWDAQQLSKYDGETWVRFYDEPWTANRFWQIQVC